MAKVKMKCHCGTEYEAREADINRGWALSCSKSCAALRRTHKLRAAIYADGKQVPNKLKSNKPKRKPVKMPNYGFDEYVEDLHPFSSEALGQWQD